MTPLRTHWDAVHGSHPQGTVSWYEATPATSDRLIHRTLPGGSVIDVGAGTSLLADALLVEGWTDITLLDVSESALAAVRARLGERPGVSYLATDLLAWTPTRRYDLWHDRAVFHFLTAPGDVERYVATASAAVVPGGALVIGTFAQDGPQQCSGLPTARYAPDELVRCFADHFTEEHREREEHRTPTGAVQPFSWAVLRRTPHAAG